MKTTKIILFFLILLFLQNIYAQETTPLEINIKSSLRTTIDSDYQINTEEIKIANLDNLEIVSGQDLLIKYVFINDLNYGYFVDFWFSGFSEDNLSVLMLEQVAFEDDCLEPNYLLKKEDKVVVTSDKDYYLCATEQLKEDIITKIYLNPNKNTKYFLIESLPNMYEDSEINNLKSFIDISKKQFYTNNLQEKKTQDVNKLNPNFQETTSSLNLKKNIGDVLDKTTETKQKITGFVSFKASSFVIILVGLILVVVLALIVTNKKKPFKNIDELHRL